MRGAIPGSRCCGCWQKSAVSRFGQFDGLLACHVIDVESQHEHMAERLVNLMLQPLFVVGRIASAQKPQGLQFFVIILYDLDATENDDASEIGGKLGGLDLVLVDDAKRAVVVLPDGIDFMTLQRRVKEDAPIGINVAQRHGIGITAMPGQSKRSRGAPIEDGLTFFS